MKYCENCHIVTDFPRCPACGAKVFREVREEDFCLLLERTASDCAVLKEIFEEENIPCVAMPSGDGFRSSLGLRLENEKLFVPYAQLQRTCARSPIARRSGCEVRSCSMRTRFIWRRGWRANLQKNGKQRTRSAHAGRRSCRRIASRTAGEGLTAPGAGIFCSVMRTERRSASIRKAWKFYR